jgi:hypothetical protein
MYFKKADETDFLTAPHAHNYGELLIKERNETEKGKRYLDLAEADGYMKNELKKPQTFCGACCKKIVTGKEYH